MWYKASQSNIDHGKAEQSLRANLWKSPTYSGNNACTLYGKAVMGRDCVKLYSTGFDESYQLYDSMRGVWNRPVVMVTPYDIIVVVPIFSRS